MRPLLAESKQRMEDDDCQSVERSDQYGQSRGI